MGWLDTIVNTNVMHVVHNSEKYETCNFLSTELPPPPQTPQKSGDPCVAGNHERLAVCDWSD